MNEKIKLVCGQCGAVNQFPRERMGADPKCGKCKAALISAAPIEVDTEALNKHIRHSGLPVLVDFWAPWCGPCRSFAPAYSGYAGRKGREVRCLKLDTEANQQAGLTFSIRSIPTLALFHQGRELNRISGALGESQLEQWVAQSLSGE